MNTIVKSLRALTTKLGGTDTTSKTVVDALKKVFGAYGGTGSTAKTISGCIDEITTVAVATPTGKLTITGTSEVNCSTYATAQVSDADLVAENIKKDVNILGVTGSYEGGGGSSDFSTATVTISGSGTIEMTMPVVYDTVGDEGIFSASQSFEAGQSYTVPLYKGAMAVMESVPRYTAQMISGNASIMADGMGILITGDCTITITST